MTHTRACITSDLALLHPSDRPRICRARVFDEESGRWVPQHYAGDECPGESCRGCVPREADHGYLCRTCYAKVRDALSRVGNLIVHLRSISKPAQALGERVQTSMEKSILVPETWLSADGLMDALGARPIPSTASIDDTFRIVQDAVSDWEDVDARVSSREDAKRAVVLVKRMQTAIQRWPDSEADWRYVPLMLCPSCGQATLHRRGPLEQGDDLLIQCAGSNLMYEQGIGYDECEFALDWFEWLDKFSRPIEAAFAIHGRKTA